MPGSLPLDDAVVRRQENFTTCPMAGEPVIESEVDGPTLHRRRY